MSFQVVEEEMEKEDLNDECKQDNLQDKEARNFHNKNNIYVFIYIQLVLLLLYKFWPTFYITLLI